MTNTRYKKKIALFLTSQAITLFGSSLVQFAIVWYVTLNTSSGFLVSMLTVCAYVPQFVISFFAGVWADRHSKKMMIILSDASIAVATLLLALIIPYLKENSVLIFALMASSVIRSIGTGIQTPSVNAVIPLLAPEEQYMRINGINSTVQSVVQFAAPAAAGAILTLSTLPLTLFIDVITAIVGIGIFSFVALPKTERGTNETAPSVFSDLIFGVKYTFSDKFLGKLLLLFGAFIFLCVPAGFLATLFVSRTYSNSYAYMTYVELVGFAGMAAGGIIIGAWGGFKNRMKTLFLGLLFFGLLATGMGAVKNFYVYLVLMLIYGIALTMVQTATTTLIQEKTSPEMQGRVFGFLGAVYSGFLPVGMVIFGPLCDKVPIRAVMIVSGILLIIISFAVLFSKRFFLAGEKPKKKSE